MNYDYINSLISVPFKENGRNLEGLDCYGLVLEVSEHMFGNKLPDWHANHTARDVARQIALGLKGVVDTSKAALVKKPQDGDIAVVAKKELPYHLGVVINNGILHTSRSDGVVFEPIAAFIHAQGRTEFYRWQR